MVGLELLDGERGRDAVNQPLVVLASERMDADRGWRMLDAGELLHVSDTLGTSTSLILDHPPARPLTLEELGPTAKASQAHSRP